MTAPEAARRRWRGSQRITAALLAVWFAVTFGVTYFARELSATVLGWPFSFWVAAQGALLVYLLLVCLYARWMARLDAEHGLSEES
ncbi:MAG: sodium/substrate symporter small subunit [Pseudomonadota bacterium]